LSQLRLVQQQLKVDMEVMEKVNISFMIREQC
jgi:hypothetical protein